MSLPIEICLAIRMAFDILLFRSREHLINISVLRSIDIRFECLSKRLDNVSEVQHHFMVVRIRCNSDGSSGDCWSYLVQGCEACIRKTS